MATLILIAWAPPVIMCLLDFFHPQDMLALGLVMYAVSFISRERWWRAGLLLGMAILTQQFAWLAVVALVLVVPRRDQWRLVAGACFSAGIIAIPLLAITSGRAWWSIVWGTGNSSSTQSVLVETGLHGHALFVVARLAPLVLTAATAAWMRARWHDEVLCPVPLLSLLTLSMLWRLVFEVNVWGYYFMAVTVLLLLLEAVTGHLRLGVVTWIIVTSIVSSDAELVRRPWFDPLPMWVWQGILLLWAFGEVISNLNANPPTDNSSHLVTLARRN